MHLWQAIIEGIVQGLTEFLPVSSSAHLVFTDHFLRLNLSEGDTVFFDVMLHLGTLLAVLAFFYKDVFAMLGGVGQLITGKLPWKQNTNGRLFIWLAVGTIPAALAGKLLKPFFVTAFQSVPGTAAFLIITGVMLLFITRRPVGERTIKSVGWKDALLIGLFQAIAILPGISRSGSTITAGFLRGLDREAAPRFSFLLSIPIILGGGLLELKDISQVGSSISTLALIAGFLAAAISGYLAVVLLLGIVRKGRLDRFAYYCAVVGILMLAYWFLFLPRVNFESSVATTTPNQVFHYTEQEEGFGPIELSKVVSFQFDVRSGIVPVDSVSVILPKADHSVFENSCSPQYIWKAGENRFYIENYKLLPIGDQYEPNADGDFREIMLVLKNRWGITNTVRFRVRVVPESIGNRTA